MSSGKNEKNRLAVMDEKVECGTILNKQSYKLFDNGTMLLCVIGLVWSAFLLWSIPPSWNSYDSYLQMVAPLKTFTIPHWPPFYPLFLKFFWLKFEFLSFDVKLYAILLTQHLLFITAVIFFASIVTRSVLKKIAIVVIFFINPLFGLMVHGIYTESLWISLIIFLIGLSIKIVIEKSPRKSIWGAYFAVLFLLCLTRYGGQISAVILPTMVFLFFIKNVIDSRNNWKIIGIRFVKTISITIILSCLTILFANVSFQIICKLSGADYYSRIGRAISYHIASANLKSLKKTEFEALTKQLQDRAIEPWVRTSVPILLFCDRPWLRCSNAIFKLLLEYKYNNDQTKSRFELRKEATLIMNQVGWLYITSLNKYYLKQTEVSFKKFVMTSGIPTYSKELVAESLNSLPLYNTPHRPRDSYSLVPYHLSCLDQKHVSRYENFKTSWYIEASIILDYLLRLYLFIPIIIIAYYLRLIDRKGILIILSLIIAILIYSLAISSVRGYSIRFSVYNYVCLSAAYCYFIGQLKIKVYGQTKT